MNQTESGIINVLKQGALLRAGDIAKALSISRREVNHYLYTSLNRLVIQDSQYRWTLKSALKVEGEQLLIPFEEQPVSSTLDELLTQHQQCQREAAFEETLQSLINSPEE
jgi:hypothetical protein